MEQSKENIRTEYERYIILANNLTDVMKLQRAQRCDAKNGSHLRDIIFPYNKYKAVIHS